MKRRTLLKSGLMLMLTGTVASVFRPANAQQPLSGGTLIGGTLWQARFTEPPKLVDILKRAFFNDKQYAQVTAIFDQLIPEDELSPSASKQGCVGFVDHQLAGNYGKAASLYMQGPFSAGTSSQGNQSSLTPAMVYQIGLEDLENDCQKQFGQSFEALTSDQQIQYLEDLDTGKITYPNLDAKFSSAQAFFNQLLKDVREGFFADPLYGGNKDMAAWKMVGFPGARYDYRDVVNIKGREIKIEPVSLLEKFKL